MPVITLIRVLLRDFGSVFDLDPIVENIFQACRYEESHFEDRISREIRPESPTYRGYYRTPPDGSRKDPIGFLLNSEIDYLKWWI